MWVFEASVEGLVEPVDTSKTTAALLGSYGFVVSEGASERIMLRSLPWVFPQSGAAPGDTGLLPTPSGNILVYDRDGGFRYVAHDHVSLDQLVRFARARGA